MHAQGDPRTMQDDPRYDDVVLDVYDWLSARIEACERAGIPRARLIVDPGIGFGKTLAHNLALLGALGMFHGLGCADPAGRLAQELHRQAYRRGCGGSPARLASPPRSSPSRRACRSCASTMLRQLDRPWRSGRRRTAPDATCHPGTCLHRDPDHPLAPCCASMRNLAHDEPGAAGSRHKSRDDVGWVSRGIPQPGVIFAYSF